MKPPRACRPLKGGLDPVGSFHPYLAYAAILLVNLLCAALIVLALLWIGDTIEDLVWPGGDEWLDL